MNRIRFLFLTIFLLYIIQSQGQYVSKILEYQPAPGQFVNTAAWGCPAKAQSLIGGVSGGISLGAYGGNIVVGFDSPIENNENNPYGIDFTIYGNPLDTWSEPGIVYVMKDENGNGLADDTWYELAGSDYYFSSTYSNYTITYTNPNSSAAADVPWTDNYDNSGAVYANSYHLQPYYPLADSFPAIDQTQYSFTGTCIEGYVDKAIPTYIMSYRRAFGYADNYPRGSAPYTVPDNPYTSEIEGCGGDPMDIDWAIDQYGNHYYLDQIDFVKIATGVNQAAGWLGEVSTEVTAVIDVEADASITGETNMAVMTNLPVTMIVGESSELDAFAFKKGRLQKNQSITWSVSDNSILSVDQTGLVAAIGEGTALVYAAYSDNSAIYDSATTEVVQPSSIAISIGADQIMVNRRELISGKVLDGSNAQVYGLEIGWVLSDSSLASFEQEDENLYVKALAEGSCWLTAYLVNTPSFRDSIQLTLLPESEAKEIYLAIKTDTSTIFPRQQITIEDFSLDDFVDDAAGDYSLSAITRISLAHALVSTFDNESFESDPRFRDDAVGNGQLYLYKLPYNNNGSVNYYYGYGGYKTDDDHASLWVVMLNNQNYYHNFHTIEICNDDEIVLYYVPDYRSGWDVTFIKTSVVQAKVNEEFQLTVNQAYCNFDNNGTITIESSSAIADAPVLVNGQAYIEDGQAVLTDETGKAFLTCADAGEKLIGIEGTLAKVVIEDDGSAVQQKTCIEAEIWPVPFTNQLNIECPGCLIESIELQTLTGKVILIDYSNKLNQASINPVNLAKGMYLVKIATSKGTIIRKVIKL